MTDTNRRFESGSRPIGPFDVATRPELFEGVLAKRVVAFLVDAVVIFVLMIPAALIVALLGLVTLGLGWFLFPPLFAVVALGYVALTLGGPNSATLGMHLLGLQMRTLLGERPYPLLAAIHALLFWFSVSVLTPLVLLAGLFSRRGRLLHDLVLGTVIVNAHALRPGE